MPDWSRRHLLAALAGGGVVGGAAYLGQDKSCAPVRDPYWTYHAERAATPVPVRSGTLVAENWTATGTDTSRLALLGWRGEARWAHVVEGAGFGVPALDGETVYVGTGLDTVLALDATTGDVRWRYDAGGRETYGGGAWLPPTGVGGRVVVGVSHSTDPNADPAESGDFVHRVVALNDADGTETWATDVDAMARTSPVVVDGVDGEGDVAVVGTDPGTIYGVALDDGERLWTTSVGGRPAADPVVYGTGAERVVSVLDDEGALHALDPATGDRRDRSAVVSGGEALVRREETLYVGGRDGDVVARSLDGSERWRDESSVRVADVAVGPDRVYALDQSGLVRALTAAEGRRSERFSVVDHPEDGCGYRPGPARFTGVAYDGGRLTVAGPWVRRVRALSD